MCKDIADFNMLMIEMEFRNSILVGFDSLCGDPLGRMELTPVGYSHLIHHLKTIREGKVLAILEVSIYGGRCVFARKYDEESAQFVCSFCETSMKPNSSR